MRKVTSLRLLSAILILSSSAFISGCATMRHPVPYDLVTNASLHNMDDIRVMVGESNSKLQNNLLESLKQESAEDFPGGPDGVKVYPILAISGGGANGAYGAGLMKGWSKEGSRPLFKIVTGVSTGAISAPYIFLDKEYDDELEKLYTTISTKDVLSSKGPLGVLFGDSMANNRPLKKLVARLFDDNMIAEIAAEHKSGRRLFVGTVNIDAQRFVVWDMGAIAVRGDNELFRDVIIASAAIPIVFPPSIFHVEADGKSYDEMHVDGGALTQVFTTFKLLEGMDEAAEKLGIDPAKVRARLFIIRNGYMSPNYKKVKDDLVSLAGRSMDTIIGSQGIGDAYRIYLYTKEGDNEYNLAFIPPDYKDNSKEMFDTLEMRRLFDRGYQDAVKGYEWHKTPPGLKTGDIAAYRGTEK